MRYFIELSYKGTAYHGWQIQQNAPSVQGRIEQALSALLRTPVSITGAGRTDTGVHAAYYIAHFDTVTSIKDPNSFCYHLNALLPFDIAIRRVIPVSDQAHARFDAIEREYRYYICRNKNPFTRETTWQLYLDLDIEAMNQAAGALKDFDDFTSFAKLHSANKTNICHVSHALWEQHAEQLVFTIRADRFLRNMVRAIVGTLVDVGRGRISPEDFRQIIAQRDLALCSGSAPACGLFLSNISYPKEILNSNTIQ